MATKEERVDVIVTLSDAASSMLRTIRRLAKSNKHIGQSTFSDLREIISSIRHNCEMRDEEIEAELESLKRFGNFTRSIREQPL